MITTGARTGRGDAEDHDHNGVLLLAGELHHLLSAIQSTSSVLVFIHRPGALEPDVVEVAAADNVPTEGAIVLHVNLAQ